MESTSIEVRKRKLEERGWIFDVSEKDAFGVTHLTGRILINGRRIKVESKFTDQGGFVEALNFCERKEQIEKQIPSE